MVIWKLTRAQINEKMRMAKKRPILASAMNPPKRARRLRVPMKFETIFADFEEERCKDPWRYVTKFIDIPITQILSESSVPKISPAATHPPVLDMSAGFPLKSTHSSSFSFSFVEVEQTC